MDKFNTPVESHRKAVFELSNFCVDNIAPSLKKKINKGEQLLENETILKDLVNRIRTDISDIFHTVIFELHGGKVRNAKDKYIWKHTHDAIQKCITFLPQLIENIEHMSDDTRRKIEPYLKKENGKETLMIDSLITLSFHDVPEDHASREIGNKQEFKECLKIYNEHFRNMRNHLKNLKSYQKEIKDSKDRRTNVYRSVYLLTHQKPIQKLKEYAEKIAKNDMALPIIGKTFDVLDNAETSPKNREKYDEKAKTYYQSGCTLFPELWEFLPEETKKTISKNNPIWPQLIAKGLREKRHHYPQ